MSITAVLTTSIDLPLTAHVTSNIGKGFRRPSAA